MESRPVNVVADITERFVATDLHSALAGRRGTVFGSDLDAARSAKAGNGDPMAVSDLFDLMPAFLSHHPDHDGSPAGRVAWCLGSAVVADTIDPETLARNMGTFQVVDVRYPNEWEAGHIDTALHIPHDDVFDRIGELGRKRPVVTVCRSGSRSAEAADDLAGEGFDVENLDAACRPGPPGACPSWPQIAAREPWPNPNHRPTTVRRG